MGWSEPLRAHLASAAGWLHFVVPISKGDGRLQVTSSISCQATYGKGWPDSRSCEIYPTKLSCKYLPSKNRTQMDCQLIIKVPFSQKWISLIKCIFHIASDLAENVPSYFIIWHLLTQLLAMLMQPQWYFHWLLTDTSCVHHIANVTRRNLTQPTLPLQSTWDPKQTFGAPSITAQGTGHPTNKYWIANLWQVENKSASPEVEEKAEFKAATESVAGCQYRSLQGSIKWFIWQADPLR